LTGRGTAAGKSMDKDRNVRRVSAFFEIVVGGVVIVESVSAKVSLGEYFFPLRDVRTEYLFPSFEEPVIDEIGDSQRVTAEVGGRVIERVGRYFYKPRARYVILKDNITFDPACVDGFFIDGR
jgi:uncharacterized protein (DUF427 family)